MKREDVEKAAAEYANEVFRPLWRTGNEQVCMTDFIEGAKWRINSIWHDASEKPKDNAMILIIDRFGFPFFSFPNSDEWEEKRLLLDAFKWAYKEDLIPNKEGEQ